MYDIDLSLLLKASNYYENLGYNSTSAPLLVDKDVINLTLPPTRHVTPHLDKYYVGSAEQSFYQLLKEGLKPVEQYMMLTPCVRDECPNSTHLGVFLKLELLIPGNNFINIFQDVFDFYSNENLNPQLVNTEEGLDIYINDLEVGSFGTRKVYEQDVSYGTGLALPRITQAINNIKT